MHKFPNPYYWIHIIIQPNLVFRALNIGHGKTEIEPITSITAILTGIVEVFRQDGDVTLLLCGRLSPTTT